jgi:hypothetical protein
VGLIQTSSSRRPDQEIPLKPRFLALVVASVATLACGLVPSPSAAATPPSLFIGDPYATRGGTLDVTARGCDGTSAIYLYSGTGATRTIAGYAETSADDLALMYVPWWIPAGVDLTVAGSCLADDGGSVDVDYPDVAVELRPDVSAPVAASGTFAPTQLMAGQRLSYTGGPCSILSVPDVDLASIVLVFSGNDPANPGTPTYVAGGPAEGGTVTAEGVVFSSDVEPGEHLALPLCTNFEAWQSLPYETITVTANPAAATIQAEANADGTVTVSGEGCEAGDVSLFLDAAAVPEGDAVSSGRSRSQRLETGDPTATVTPEADGSWTYTWPGPAPAPGVVFVTAVCGDINGDGWIYDQILLRIHAPATTTTSTTAVAAPPAVGAQPVRATPTYAG